MERGASEGTSSRYGETLLDLRYILKANPTEFVLTWMLNVSKREEGIQDDSNVWRKHQGEWWFTY